MWLAELNTDVNIFLRSAYFRGFAHKIDSVSIFPVKNSAKKKVEKMFKIYIYADYMMRTCITIGFRKINLWIICDYNRIRKQ